jgi:hypothetical protein
MGERATWHPLRPPGWAGSGSSPDASSAAIRPNPGGAAWAPANALGAGLRPPPKAFLPIRSPAGVGAPYRSYRRRWTGAASSAPPPLDFALTVSAPATSESPTSNRHLPPAFAWTLPISGPSRLLPA